MQLQPDDQNDDCRTIFFLQGSKVEHKTLTKKLSDWTWRTIAELKRHMPEAIGFLKRESSGILRLTKSNHAAAAQVPIPRSKLREALLDQVGIKEEKITPGLFSQIPKTVIRAVEGAVYRNALSVKKQWVQKGENQLTGQVFGYIEPFRVGDYEVKLASVEFSSIAKEPNSGADVALLLHTSDIHGNVEIKTVWFQGKRANSETQTMDEMKDLKSQMSKMLSINKQSYPLVFRPSGAVVYKNTSSHAPIEFSNFMGRAAECEFGTTDLDIFADSLDRNSIFELAITKMPRKPKGSGGAKSSVKIKPKKLKATTRRSK